MDELKERLRDRYICTYKECKKFHYSPTAFMRMVTSDEDIVEVTKRLIHKPGGTEGFTTLFFHDKMELSVEKIILEPEFRQLFLQEDLQVAYDRLKEHQYKYLDQIEEPHGN